MDFTTILVALALMGTVCSSPVNQESKEHCPADCENAPKYQQLDFQHISDLKDTSVAPWKLTFNNDSNREPQSIQVATCQKCTLPGMVAEPIYLKISVIQSKGFGDSAVRCKCPFELAVGCTCVQAQTAQSQ